MAAKRPAPLKLFWCATADHDEDWFVVARTSAQARRIHEREEGYDAGDATADLVCPLPASLSGAEVGWPSEAVLRACGVEVTADATGSRIVRHHGRVFVEGNVVMNAAARLGMLRRH
jgi:hypothetical protein